MSKIERMQKLFPRCPICGSEKGYEFSAFYPNVQCESCKAEWLLSEDGMELKGVSQKGWDRKLLNKKHTFQFWRTLKIPKEVEKAYAPLRGMTRSEYEACIDNLGLLEGEEIRLQYVVAKKVFRKSATSKTGWTAENRKGLLVFTNDNLIFMQQEGIWSSNYSPALRIPVEQISGIESGGKLIRHIRFRIGLGGDLGEHEFIFPPALLERDIHDIRKEIDELLLGIRQERKRLAMEAIVKGTVLEWVFCKYCGTRNKSDHSICINCGAPL